MCKSTKGENNLERLYVAKCVCVCVCVCARARARSNEIVKYIFYFSVKKLVSIYALYQH